MKELLGLLGLILVVLLRDMQEDWPFYGCIFATILLFLISFHAAPPG